MGLVSESGQGGLGEKDAGLDHRGGPGFAGLGKEI